MRLLGIGFLILAGLGVLLGVLVACAAGRKYVRGADGAEKSSPNPRQLLAVGSPAPDFSVMDEQGTTVTLGQFRGRNNVVLIFYPGNNTPVCTSQLCKVRDEYTRFEGKDIVVFGVNPADARSHLNFSGKYKFPFRLLVDADKQLIRSYGCVGTLMTQRTVYGIDKNGIIVFAQRGRPAPETIVEAF